MVLGSEGVVVGGYGRSVVLGGWLQWVRYGRVVGGWCA